MDVLFDVQIYLTTVCCNLFQTWMWPTLMTSKWKRLVKQVTIQLLSVPTGFHSSCNLTFSRRYIRKIHYHRWCFFP